MTEATMHDDPGRTVFDPDEIQGLTFWSDTISAQAVDYQSGWMIRVHQMEGTSDPAGAPDIEISIEDVRKLAALADLVVERGYPFSVVLGRKVSIDIVNATYPREGDDAPCPHQCCGHRTVGHYQGHSHATGPEDCAACGHL